MKNLAIAMIVSLASVCLAEISPQEGAALNRIHVQFSWDAVPSALSYEIEVVVDDGSPDPFVNAPVATDTPSGTEAVITAGLAFGQDYAWRTRGVDGGGPLPWSATNRMSTLTPPAYIPPFTTTYDPNQAGDIQPGITIVPVRNVANVPGGLIVAFDVDGNLVWFLERGGRVSDPRLLPNGHILFMNDFRGVETDLDGNTIWESPDDPNMLVHHEVYPMPNGNRMMLLYTYHQIERFTPGDVNRDGNVDLSDLAELLVDFGCDDWPCGGDVDLDIDTDLDDLAIMLQYFGEMGTEMQRWRGDKIVELDPNNNVVWEFEISGNTPETDFDFDFMEIPRVAGGPQDNAYDWTHCNAVVYNPADNGVYISVRNLSQVWRVDYTTKNIDYQMGFQMPSGSSDFGDEFFSFQHAVELQPDGNILLFDNGNRRDRIVHANNSVDTISKAVEIELTGNPATDAQIVWEWDTPFYSFALGDADRQPNGNTIAVNGVNSTVSEVDDQGNLIWQMTAPAGNSFYRAQRVPSLYP